MTTTRTTISVRTLLAIILAAILDIYPMSGLEAQEGRIRGTVLVGESSVDDADVTIQSLGRRMRADGAGRFSFDRIPPGTYVVEAESSRWGRGAQTVRVIADETSEVSVRLEAVFHLDEIIVSAGVGAPRRSEAYQPASVVTSRDLVARGEASLGETLARQPGVSSSFFGPGASRPIIRGMGGDRVRVLEGGIGVGDASSTSPDHAVALETRTAERVEVIRGPATLLYGSSAVGGIVNVLDERIAREPPTQTVSGYVEGLGGSVADERTGSAAVTAKAGALVLSASGLWRDASDYSIPGVADADPAPGEQLAEGVVANSGVESRRGSVGASVVAERGYLGVALSAQRSDYGVPGGEPGEAGITIDLNQDRVDVAGALRFGAGVLRTLSARFGASDYTHVELEGADVGTSFFNDYFEGRMEAEHAIGERVRGSMGTQLSSRDFEAIGDEAFVPPSQTRSAALFVYEDLRVAEALGLQAGARLERQSAESEPAGLDRTAHALSASTGLNWEVSSVFTLAVSGSRSVRHPNAEELFSNGPHAATRAFEIGNPNLSPETALGLDVTAHVHGDRFLGSANLFVTRFSDYIYEAATGNVQDGLTEFAFTQDDAWFRGFEVEGEIHVVEGDPASGSPHVALDFVADAVSAKLAARDEYLPRIPPLRFGGGVSYRQGPFTGRASATRTTGQGKVGPFEDSTNGFTMIDTSLSYRVFTGRLFHDITLVGNNLANRAARLHTSFLKDVAPLPGREIRLVYRLNF
jgi:iron complex outermembrane receptor protein